ncbi:hypothetical protein N5923_21755 [Erwiniaceae bacterium BAC15a-03b]|uniref:Uncharacterized protein n=1 Tax=Winslowiella arboricola TaxID=2978220 RepID=A0A9J6PP98_9GAMM|nr:hypothetical protein [Winslowiella arboricola]MCU5774727.1 hypothetical protein [Winslowiella arboricola]MCU5780121.1 hypothetical protein [Winslowiella arboricola]
MALNYFGKAWQLAFEISPIMLVGGLAATIPGSTLPIAVFTEGLSIVSGLMHGELGNGATARFMPMAGTTLIQQEIGNLNFYNQTTAANAVVNKPNRINMQMQRPVSTRDGGYATKSLTFTALKMALDKHNQLGGSYNVLTPAFIYTGCLLRSLSDNSGFSAQNKQAQHSWVFEFEQPLLVLSQLEAVLGNLMNKFESGLPATGGLGWTAQGNQIAGPPPL